MELKKVNVSNKGMSQDYSISKDIQEYAFENRNIRIQALDDSTLLSVTNIKGPKKLTETSIQGHVLGKCFTNKYLILFTLNADNEDCIYRIEFKNNNTVDCKTLYLGTDLHFEPDRTFDTLFYYENSNIQKVYWVESWYSDAELKEYSNRVNNPPRCINIITEGERNGGEYFTPYTKNDFDFYPNIESTPEFDILKDYSIQSELPTGIILYFITYYFENGTETLIANNSSIFTIDYNNRGAKAAETGCCGFLITISNVDTKFDYFRIYSTIRTSKDGPIILRIVGDTKINKNGTSKTLYIVKDNGINLETLNSDQLFFIGGTPFYAKTLEQKDDTLFIGNIKTQSTVIPNEIKNIIDSRKIYYYNTPKGKIPIKKLYVDNSFLGYYTTLGDYLALNNVYPTGKTEDDYKTENITITQAKKLFYPECIIDLSIYSIDPESYNNIVFVDCEDITFDYKSIATYPNNSFSSFYNYRLQTINSDKDYKTFKKGEMYRFGIQFQTKQGLWSYILWLGDKECNLSPKNNNDLLNINVSSASYTIPEKLKLECEKYGYSNYRLVIADPETLDGRRIVAQGIVCPTLFSPGQRALGNSHSISSWIMRPRGFKTSYNHFEPIGSTFSDGAEIFGYDCGNVGKTFPLEENEKIPVYFTPDGYNKKYLYYSSPYKNISESSVINTNFTITTKVVALSVTTGKKAHLKITTVLSKLPFDKINWNDTTTYSLITTLEEIYNERGSNGWTTLYKKLYELFKSAELDPNTVPNPSTLQRMANNALDNVKAQTLYELLHPAETYTINIKSEIVSKGFRQLLLYNNQSYGLIDDLFTSIYLNNPTASRDYMLITTFSSVTKFNLEEVENEMNNFYIDESIVTFHSPDIPKVSNINAKFRVVGVAPINSIYTDLEILTSTMPYINGGRSIHEPIISSRMIGNSICNGLYSGYLYTDGYINAMQVYSDYDSEQVEMYFPAINYTRADYKMYLWDKLGSIPGVTNDVKTIEYKDLLEFPSILKTKTFFNLLHSFGNIYISPIKYNPSEICIFNEGSTDTKVLNTDNRKLLYNGNYDYLITREKGMVLYKHNSTEITEENELVENPYIGYDHSISAPVRIKFDSTTHAILDLQGSTRNYKKLLPKIEGEVGFDYNKTNKNRDTHEWGYTNEDYRNTECCWTSEEDVYKDNSWFTALLVDSNYSDIENVKSIFLDYFNTLEGKEFIIQQYKKGTAIYLGTIYDRNNTHPSITDYLDIIINKKEKINDCVYSLYKIIITKNGLESNILTASVIEVQPIKAIYGGTVSNVFTYENTYSYGRFQWLCTQHELHDNQTVGIPGGIIPYKRFPIKYELPVIPSTILEDNDFTSYLFIGELYYDTEPKYLYGGYDNIKNLVWYPISTVTTVDKNIYRTSGDTYYQRWDCLKTFPKTEDDYNKVVDITSFMVETRKNLDSRTDSNRGNYNLMSRPSNFNLFNTVYDFKNNLFLYNAINSDLVTTEFKNQFTWTLKKNFASKIDSWTNAGLWNISQCDSPITRLVKYNNQIFSLNENSVEIINYNNKNLITSEDSTVIELANSNIVDGTTKLFSVYGTHNNSILITEKGLYFIEDNEKSLIRISSDGSLLKIGIGKMDSWFKNNIGLYSYTAATRNRFHLEYDSIHKDVYIIGNNDCLIYNEALDSFTSFVDYTNLYTIFNNKGSLYSIALNNNLYFDVYKMFEGEYNMGFNGLFLPYTILYRINPDPYSDKVFTNIEFIADYGSPGLKVFDTIKVWNEYLDTGEVPLEFKRNYPSNLKLKFRIWRADIPRDANSKWKRDRIRNPWIHLKLTKNPTDTNKMEFHSMNVQYML